jgi:hypothetical protein
MPVRFVYLYIYLETLHWVVKHTNEQKQTLDCYFEITWDYLQK